MRHERDIVIVINRHPLLTKDEKFEFVSTLFQIRFLPEV